VRVGLVSPYSYTYSGGVGGHAEALAEGLLRLGHEVRLLAPYDPDDRLARVMHRGARPQRRPVPDYLIPLGRTVGLAMNGAVSNVSLNSAALAVLGHELRTGGYDVVHVHEPNVPVVSWCAVEWARAPVVGTFHTYSTSFLANAVAANVAGARRLYAKLSARIAVSEAAAWTARRFYGGHYRIVPNGVDLSAARPAAPARDGELRLLFVGRAEGRKGLPVLLRAFEALRSAGIAARLTIAGATAQEVEPLLLDPEGVHVAGRVSDEQKWRLLGEADVLCAPSLGGESFGMVLTEAFASGTPVVASDIAGYRDVVRDGADGLLVPAAGAVELGEALRGLALDPSRRARMAAAARERAERFAWPRVTREVTAVYEEALAQPRPEGQGARAATRAGLRPAAAGPRERPRRLPSLEPRSRRGGRPAVRALRRVAMGAAATAGLGLTALALHRLGIQSIGRALLAATPWWVLVSFALMCSSMLMRSEAWHAVLRAALPGVRVRRRDAARATMIGVLMSATLPARLGEPSRALIVARRLGRMRDRFPLVLGTLVSQTLLNILALSVLGSVMFATVGLFNGNEDALALATMAPVVVLALVLSAPWLLRRGRPSRWRRVQQAAAVARRAMVQVRSGLAVFRRPRLGSWAALMQLSAWALQWLACYGLLVAFGLQEHAGLEAAAAVLFAVNVTAALPATPSNLGVFQAACVAVLSAYGVGKTDAFAYGIILQAVEIATALTMGMPALVREGMTWKDLRLRALHAAPVELSAAARRGDAAEAEA
jgi:phosphatidylinositol alpha-mannosyltransferase